MRKAAIILAGGSGKRFGGNLPKQFVKLCGKTILFYSIEKFVDKVDVIVVVCHKDYISMLEKEVSLIGMDISIVEGGETRQLSVRNGLLSLKDKGIEYVAIHDGSRPLFSIEMLISLFNVVVEKKAVVPVLPLSSTIAKVEENYVDSYLEREMFFMVQTPQVFEFSSILNAHEKAFREKRFDFTDDSQVFKYAGKKVYVINGEETNIKITTKPDLLYAEWLISFLKKRINS